MIRDELRSLFALIGVEDALQKYVITAGVNSVLVFSRIRIPEQKIRDRVVKHWVDTLPSPVALFCVSSWRSPRSSLLGT